MHFFTKSIKIGAAKAGVDFKNVNPIPIFPEIFQQKPCVGDREFSNCHTTGVFNSRMGHGGGNVNIELDPQK